LAALGGAVTGWNMRCSTAFAVSLVLLLGLGSGASAQKAPAPEKPAAAKPKAKTAPVKEATPVQPPAPQVVMPDADKIVLLVRNTLITLNDAIQTGNFTVLRDRGAPGFSEANSAARLGQIFSNLAKSGVDLSIVSIVTPQLTENPALDQASGMLNIKGYFPTRPQQINFEVMYQSVGGRWRLFGLSVQPSAAPTPASPQALGGAPQSQP
jgi:hypothetical protein